MKYEYEQFYRDGIRQIDFKSREIDKVLSQIKERKIKEGFSLDSKYRNTWDLRPDVINYDPVFLNALKENDIKNTLRKNTLKDYIFHTV